MPRSQKDAPASAAGTGKNVLASARADIGGRIRQAREQRKLSLRGLAAQLDISPSGLSQIETGRSRPSVGTLYAIVSELGISMDDLFVPDGGARPVRERPGSREIGEPTVAPRQSTVVQRANGRRVIELETGVAWERLSPPDNRNVEFLEVTYGVGGASSGTGTLIHHPGREYGVVLSGILKVTVGSHEYELAPGDSICFESALPHRLETVGEEPVRAVWLVLGRAA